MEKNWAHGWDEKWESSSSYDFWNTQKLSAATDVWMKWILFYRASGEIWGRDACNAWNNIIYANEGEQKGPKRGGAESSCLLIGASGGGGPIPFISLSLSQSVDCLLQLSSFSAFLIRTEVCGQAIWPAQFRAVGPLRPRQNNLRRTFSAQFGSSLRNEKSLFYHIGHSCHADFTEYSNNCFFFWRNLNFPSTKLQRPLNTEHNGQWTLIFTLIYGLVILFRMWPFQNVMIESIVFKMNSKVTM